MAIEPGDRSVAQQDSWDLQNRGTTINVYRDFVNLVCTDIDQKPIMPTDIHRIFETHDSQIVRCPP
jgi:hypothetical protein